ncbi:MAG: hypothetical protein ACE5FJ_05635 [Gemmatimonadales bacterium]
MRPIIVLAVLASTSSATSAQDGGRRAPLSGRWVGVKSNVPTRGFWIEFFNDSLLVVDDRYPLRYVLTPDSLIAVGDTTVIAAYERVADRLLLYTPEGLVITMSPQSDLARPLAGLWIGELGLEQNDRAELVLFKNGAAQWRRVPGGEWQVGEWDRTVRTITLSWEADSTQWVGFHDPPGNALQFVNTLEGGGSVVFRKTFRQLLR